MARLPVLIAWLVIAAILGTLGSQPRLLAPYASSLVSRHLLRLERGGLRVRDFQLHGVSGMELYGVAMTLPRDNGGLTLVSADTVRVEYGLAEVLGSPPRLRRLRVVGPELYARAGRDTTVQAASVGEGLNLPRLVVDRLAVDDAHLEFSDGDGRLRERLTGVDFRGAFDSRDELDVTIAAADADWESRGTLLRGVGGDLRVDAEGFHADSLAATVNEGAVAISGTRGWQDAFDIVVRGRGVSVAETENLLDMALGFSARGDLDGRFHRRDGGLRFAGRFAGELEGYTVEDLALELTVRDDAVELSAVDGRFNGATLRGDGRIEFGPPVVLVLAGDVADVDLARGLVPGDKELPRTSGHGRLRLEHRDEPRRTRVHAFLRDGHVAVLPFDSCLVDVVADVDSVRFRPVRAWRRDLELRLVGAADTSGHFRGSLAVGDDDLATLPARWGWPQLAGAVRGEGRLEGPLEALRFRGRAELTAPAIEPLAADRAGAELVVDDVLGEPAVRAAVTGTGLTVRGVPLGAFRLRGEASARGARVDTFGAARGDTTVDLAFTATFTDSAHSFRVARFAIDLEGTSWRLDRPVELTAGGGVFALPEARFASPGGSLTVDGRYRRGATVAGHLALDRFDLGLLAPFVGTREPLRGTLTAEAVLGGVPDAPEVDFTARLVDAPFALARVDTLAVAASYGRGAFDIRSLRLATPVGRVRADGRVAHPGVEARDFWPGAELDLEVDVVEGDWGFLEQFELPALDRLAGTFAGDLRVQGTTTSPLVRGRLTSAPFHIHWLHLDELTGDVWADDASLVLGSLRGRKDDLEVSGHLEVPVDLDFLSTPVTPPQGPFYLQVEIPPDSDLAPLARATNAFVTASGRGEASVVVSGPLDHPLYQGSLAVRDGGCVLRGQEEVYRDVTLDGELRGDVLELTRIRGEEGLRGTFRGRGEVVFDGLELETWRIDLDLDRFLIASIPDLRVLVRSDAARMTGVRVGPDSVLVPRFSGNLEVIKARYTGSFGEQGDTADPLQATVAPDWLADLTLHGEPRSAHIVNRDMELDLGGDMNLVRDETGLYLRGGLDVNAGRLIVFNNSFKVVRGRLDFSNELGFDPRVDLDAELKYRLRSEYSSDSYIETIGVHVGGRLSQPEITFSSQRGYSRAAIQRMLLGLDPHGTQGGEVEALQATGISAGLNVIEREFAREMDIFDTFEIEQIRRQRATGATGLDPMIGVGKYIGPDLYLKYARGLSVEDQDIVVEYQINRHLLLQTEMRRRLDENQGQPTYNLDLKYRFEY